MLRLVVMVALLIVGWLFLAPTRFGGDTTYALVTGHSMEPTLHDGTLVVARVRPSYSVGQVVVYKMHGGHVMHRLVGIEPDGEFTSRGDNNEYNDPWHVSTDEIVGEVVMTVPLAGAALTWTARHPIVTALLAAAVVLLAFIPRRRRQVTPDLAQALHYSVTEGPPTGQSSVLRPALWAGYAMTALCAVAAAFALATHAKVWPTMTLTLGGLIVCAAGLEYLEAVLYDGRGLAAEARAKVVFAGRSRWLALPVPPDGSFTPGRVPIAVASPEELRDKAIAFRVPVLHRVDPVSGQDDYVVITTRVDFRWSPPPPGAISGVGIHRDDGRSGIERYARSRAVLPRHQGGPRGG